MYPDSWSWIWKFPMSVPWYLHTSGSKLRTFQFEYIWFCVLIQLVAFEAFISTNRKGSSEICKGQECSLLKRKYGILGRRCGQVRNILPDIFPIVFDAWTTSDLHYIAMYATFAYDCTLGYTSVLLAFSPFESEDSRRAENHYPFILFVLELFGKSIEYVVALVGENCSSNCQRSWQWLSF